jgi:hypothetical protein
LNGIGQWSKILVFSVVVLFARIDRMTTGSLFSVHSPKPVSCVAPEYRRFDFWIGDWDAFEVDNPTIKVARTRVELILDGCVLREDYNDPGGLQGQSFTIYDSSRGIWHQSWVTNRGKLLIIEGQFHAGEMVLTGVDYAGGEQTLIHGTWKPVDGGVRETAVTSADGGKTWKTWFDLMFRPHKS